MKKNEWTGRAAMLSGKERFPCVTLILPVHRKSPERTTDREALQHALEEVRAQLVSACDEATATLLMDELNRLAASIDFTHNKDGVGLYVSTQVSALMRFPFPVTHGILIGDEFRLREVLFMEQYFPEFLLLTVSGKEARLLKGNYEGLKEVYDQHFPFHFTDDYLYNRPSFGTSYGYAMKEFEREATVIKEKRQKSQMKELNTLLPSYLSQGARLVIAGTERNLLHYAQTADPALQPDATMKGNFDHHPQEQLLALVLPVVDAALQEESRQYLAEFQKAANDKMAATGIVAAWNAAAAGKGWHLLVEKDYNAGAYSVNDPDRVTLQEPEGPHVFLPDGVEALIRLVHSKNGKVSFVANDSLSEYGRVALLLRYP